jgi:hypothetical protein
MPRALNPNHPVVQATQEQCYKLCARAFTASGNANISIYPKDDVITLRLHSDEEAQKLAREAGGLPT